MHSLCRRGAVATTMAIIIVCAALGGGLLLANSPVLADKTREEVGAAQPLLPPPFDVVAGAFLGALGAAGAPPLIKKGARSLGRLAAESVQPPKG